MDCRTNVSLLYRAKELRSERWGIVEGNCQVKGIGSNAPDGLIATTAFEHDLTLVTRNVKDFAVFGIAILNPWEHL